MHNNSHIALYTDHYELTMAQGYFLSGKKDIPATFDYFFRKNPFSGGYVIFTGLRDLLNILANYYFDDESAAYLKSIGFHDDFINYLTRFRFKGDIYACNEGEVVFPLEPIVRIEGNLIETQIIETLLLNILNFGSLIATKASRIRKVAKDKLIIDFGLRRAQGLGGIHASKAAIIGGFNSTSNVYSAYEFGLKSTGTMAHSWVQSFTDELTAFNEYARLYPENCVLLVDTYNTLKSGVPNAIKTAKKLKKQGFKLTGIRLDSGDLAYLSKKARNELDKEGLNEVKIIVSNQLDEYIIRSLLEQGAPIDGFGVGTEIISGRPDAALDGVYKLSEYNGKPRIKLSDNIDKITLPGKKEIIRYIDDEGNFYADGIILSDEDNIDFIYHPFQRDKNVSVSKLKEEKLLNKVMGKGRIIKSQNSIHEISQYAQKRLSMLPAEHQRFENPHVYKIGISKGLMDLRSECIQKISVN